MHGVRDGRILSSSPPSMLTDETIKNDNNTTTSSHNPPTELAYLPIGCSVSAKYRGAFCSAQVKAIEKQVKLKVTLVDSGDTITISEEQIVHSIPLRIGNTVTIRLTSSNRRQSNDSNSHHQHYSRSGLAAFINPTNPDEKQATIKQIIDNSIYTVVFNDGDEKSLRRSSLCLQGIRLYQTQYGQQKILEEIPASTSPPPPPPQQQQSSSSIISDPTNTNLNDITSIVAIKRPGNNDQQVFPALVLKRKALPDYMWVRSFVDGREYIVHTRDDVQSYENPDIQSLCRSTSKQATQACEKFIKYNHIPTVWQKKKKKQFKSDNKNNQSDLENTSETDSNSSQSDDDDDDDDDDDEIDEETTEEKDSFVAQLFAFMDDRGTPINNIPKVQNYDLDLHRLFKIVRMFGGYNKVTKNDQWSKVHIKMGLPDEITSENGRSIEHAYKKYLFAYEDLSKKLGSMNAPSAYFGGRTSMSSDSRRSLIRVRQQQHEEEKLQKKNNKSKQSPASVKQRSRKSNESRPSVDSKQTSSSTSSTTKKSTLKSSKKSNRKVPNKIKPSNILSSSTSDSESQSESETSDNDDDDDDNDDDDRSSHSSTSNYNKTKTKTQTSSSTTTTSKKPVVSTTTATTIAKKTNQVPSSSSSSTKNDIKKTSTNTKSISSSTNNDNKQSKLTITIPIAKPKNQSTNSTSIQTIKKSNLITSNKDEKKKPIETKTTSIKTEPKTPSSSSTSTITKKPLISSAKTPQLNKTNQQHKQSSNESIKSTTINKTPSSILPFKPKTTQSQTSLNSKDRNIISKPTSTDTKQIKSTNKINSSSTKTLSQERSISVPIKKTKPIHTEENSTKTISSSSTIKIPKISSNNDSTKKSTISIDKIPKKQLSKEATVKIPKIQDNTTTNKSNTDQQIKPQKSSPTHTIISEPIKKIISQDASPLPVTPISPPPAPSSISISSISDEPITPTILSASFNTTQNTNYPNDNITSESPLIFQSISNENDIIPSNSIKRPYSDDNSESIHISDIDNQLSPSKRTRRSISSQESLETISDQTIITDTISTNRNTQLTYEDISINDILLVTWGNQGIKQYPARCIEKNDEKKELFVHYTGWNSRHDEWIKLDRVIERKDSTNANTLFQQRPRRTSQINTYRQHLDSTNSNELNNQQQQQNIDINSLSLTSIDTDDEQNKIHKINKIEESDIDDNSQGQSEIWNHVETISSTEDDALSCTSITRINQSDLNQLPIEETINIQPTISITNNENILENHNENENLHETETIQDDNQIQQDIPKRRQSRTLSINNKIEPVSIIKTEQTESISSDIVDQPHQYPLHVKEETIDNSLISQQSLPPPPLLPPVITSLIIEPITPSTNILASPPATATGNRRASVRQQKRRSLRESNTSKDSSISAKKKIKLDNGNIPNTDIGIDNNDQLSTRSNSTEQQIPENTTTKRYRPSGRRGGKRSVNQQEYENEDYRSNSPSNITMRQQLKDMFKHRPSRYNFLDLNNNLNNDERITHLKDRMRECQKVFFNLKSALGKIEKQRKIFLRKQKPLISTTIIQTPTTDLLGTSTCT